jgi:hypothetical protein
MSTWSTTRQAEYERQDRRRRAADRRAWAQGGGGRHGARGSVPERISAWCGYRLINLGCRLLRPALLTGTGA